MSTSVATIDRSEGTTGRTVRPPFRFVATGMSVDSTAAAAGGHRLHAPTSTVEVRVSDASITLLCHTSQHGRRTNHRVCPAPALVGQVGHSSISEISYRDHTSRSRGELRIVVADGADHSHDRVLVFHLPGCTDASHVASLLAERVPHADLRALDTASTEHSPDARHAA